MSRRDEILTTELAGRMLDMISPIYDDSYVALWITEALAREFDRITGLVESFADQGVIETATWGLECWEKRYGITPPPNATTEERREAVKVKRDTRSPVNPAKIQAIVKSITGGDSTIVENSDSYTFTVYVSAGTQQQLNEIYRVLNRLKPAHMSMVIVNSTSNSNYDYQGVSVWRKKRITLREVF